MNSTDGPEITEGTAQQPAPEAAPPEASTKTTASEAAPLPPLPPGSPGSSPLVPAAQAWQPQAKSPILATFLAVVFLGHFYVGAYQRAIVFIVSFWLAIWVLPWPLIKVFIPLFIWFFNIFDAYRQAQLANLEESEPKQLASSKGTLLFGLFLIAVGGFLLLFLNFDIDFEWLERWWPAIIILAGAYVIYGAIREQMIQASDGGGGG